MKGSAKGFTLQSYRISAWLKPVTFQEAQRDPVHVENLRQALDFGCVVPVVASRKIHMRELCFTLWRRV